MHRVTTRLSAALALSLGVLLVPVTDLAQAAPRPVAPRTTVVPLGGVDRVALGAAPAAYLPQAVRGQAPTPGTPRVSAGTTPAVFTGELALPASSTIGVTWAAPAARGTGPGTGPVVQLRLRAGGAWGDWQPLGLTDSAPDPGSAEAKRPQAARAGTEPVFVPAGADGAQVRIDGDPGVLKDLRLVAIDPGSSPADARTGRGGTTQAHAGSIAPRIVSRADWGADESLRSCAPTYAPTIKSAIVHHSASTNAYTAAQSAAQLRGIYAYHTKANGWCDLGYNYVVDRFGTIFEGRAGGLDRAVIGAHTGGFNYLTFGVAGMGDFSTATPPPAMVASIGQVVGYKLGLYGRAATGQVTLTSAGSIYTRYAEGTPVTLNVVSGHRDPGLTACPGNALYAQLGTIRTIATQYAAANRTADIDLVGVLTQRTGSGQVEVHTQSASSNYRERLSSTWTPLPTLDPSEWRVFVGPSGGDTRPDLVAVHTRNTRSGKVEVAMLTWASGYQRMYTATTPMWTFTPERKVQMALGGPSGGDLSFILTDDTGSGRVEVHTLSGASDYTRWTRHTALPIGQGVDPAAWRFLTPDGTDDLYAVLHGGRTGSGRSEVHSLTGASNLQQWDVHAALPIGYVPDSGVQWALRARESGRPDLVVLQTEATGSGLVEVHTLAAESTYQQWSMHAATNLPAYGSPRWQLDLG